MKLLILALCVASAIARPDVSHVVGKTNSDAGANIVQQELDVNPDGSFKWGYQSDNGISVNGQGHLENQQSEEPSQVMHGGASWTSPEGDQVQFSYTADENGFQPQGSHLPTPPPIPEAIVRSLEYIRSHPPEARN